MYSISNASTSILDNTAVLSPFICATKSKSSLVAHSVVALSSIAGFSIFTISFCKLICSSFFLLFDSFSSSKLPTDVADMTLKSSALLCTLVDGRAEEIVLASVLAALACTSSSSVRDNFPFM
ncbi:hypothetical protein HanRHA438_Chr15g0712401 [Helianthus annuus]|nr:hypothetical protein HanRHA438_Chr15g0712401 [Helianthus annuus]